MNKATEHALIFLEKANDWVTKQELRDNIKEMFPRANISLVFRDLNNMANIGYLKGQYHWYERREGDKKMEMCIKESRDW